MAFNETYPYNLVELKNSTEVSGIVKYINKVSDGLFIPGMVIALFFVMLLAFRRFGIERALAASSFLCLILSILLNAGHLLTYYFIVVFAVLTILSGLWLWIRE